MEFLACGDDTGRVVRSETGLSALGTDQAESCGTRRGRGMKSVKASVRAAKETPGPLGGAGRVSHALHPWDVAAAQPPGLGGGIMPGGGTAPGGSMPGGIGGGGTDPGGVGLLVAPLVGAAGSTGTGTGAGGGATSRAL